MQRRKPRVKSTLTSIRRKSFGERIADALTNVFGTLGFFIVNALFFLVWIVLNTGLVPGVNIFDPFPFNLLTMFVSLEAIFLSVIVLISQNKAANVADIREEIDFRVNVYAEQEITKMLRMLEVVEKHLEIKTRRDRELNSMKHKLNIERIAAEVMNERLKM